MQRPETLTVVVPALNEMPSVNSFLKEAQEFLIHAETVGLKVHFLFVDNGSTDGTFEALFEFISKSSNFSLVTCGQRGYGAALKQGFSKTQTDYIGFIDLDSTYPIQSFVSLIENMRSDQSLRFAIGNRMHSHSKMPLVRRFGNFLYRTLINVVFQTKIPDACSGMRVVRVSDRQVLLQPSNNGLAYSVQLTCLMLKMNWKFRFIDIIYNERSGPSKLSIFRDGFDFLKEILVERFTPAARTHSS